MNMQNMRKNIALLRHLSESADTQKIKPKPYKIKGFGIIFGALARIRTGGVPLRRRTLYPAEVQAHLLNFINITTCLFGQGKR